VLVMGCEGFCAAVSRYLHPPAGDRQSRRRSMRRDVGPSLEGLTLKPNGESAVVGEMTAPGTSKSSTTIEGTSMTRNRMRPIHPGEILREEFLVPLGMSAHASRRRFTSWPHA
jgi:hypothetical protein